MTVVTLVAGGDVNVQDRRAPARAFDGVRSTLDAADIRFVNLEGPLSGTTPPGSGPDIAHKPNWRHSDPAMVEALTTAHIDVVSCANNVTFPPAAALSSLSVLDAAGIGHCGAGATIAAAHQPAVVERGGEAVAFLAYTSICWPFGHAATRDTPGVAAMRATTSYRPDYRVGEVPGRAPTVLTAPVETDLQRLTSDVRNAQQSVDRVVVSIHWGIPGQDVCDYQRTVGHAAIDAGASIVVGHGPHSVHPVEMYRGKPIFYSVGNLVFDWSVMHGRHLHGLLITAAFDDAVTITPIARDTTNTAQVLTGPVARGVLDALAAQSAPLGAYLRVHGDTATLDLR